MTIQSYSKEEIHSYSLELIEELKRDGAVLNSDYIFYHVVSSVKEDGDDLERFLVDIFKNEYDAFDPEHITKEELISEATEDELRNYKFEIPEHGIYTTDVLVEGELNIDKIVEDSLKIQEICLKHGIHYQLWGTFIDDGEDEEVVDPFEN